MEVIFGTIVVENGKDGKTKQVNDISSTKLVRNLFADQFKLERNPNEEHYTIHGRDTCSGPHGLATIPEKYNIYQRVSYFIKLQRVDICLVHFMHQSHPYKIGQVCGSTHNWYAWAQYSKMVEQLKENGLLLDKDFTKFEFNETELNAKLSNSSCSLKMKEQLIVDHVYLNNHTIGPFPITPYHVSVEELGLCAVRKQQPENHTQQEFLEFKNFANQQHDLLRTEVRSLKQQNLIRTEELEMLKQETVKLVRTNLQLMKQLENVKQEMTNFNLVQQNVFLQLAKLGKKEELSIVPSAPLADNPYLQNRKKKWWNFSKKY